MRVSAAMWTDIQTVSPQTPVGEAVITMADSHLSALPVVNSRNRLIGVLSTTDVLQAEAECATKEERAQLSEETAVADLMTPRPATISPEADVKEAAQQMLYLEVHRLFVEEDGKLVGVISQSDIVRAVATAKV